MAQYVSGDWHGTSWAWPQVKAFLKPDDILYYLGDATGRCNQVDGGWENFKEMLDDSRVFCLLGNHEDMVLDFILCGDYYLCSINGEMSTIEAIRLDLEADKYVEKIKRLPLYYIYTRPDGKKVFMSHSGSTNTDDKHDLIWDRSEYFTTQNWTEYDYVIHGHTRPQHIIKDLNNANEFYGLEKKYVIPAYTGGAYFYLPWRATVDCGTVLSNQITLLNIDTFEEEIFNAPSSQNELY